MEKEIIELLKTVVGKTEILIIWYMILHLIQNVLQSATILGCFYYFGRGFKKAVNYLNGDS